MATPLALTPGDPAGIGPDLALMLARDPGAEELAIFADPDMVAERARLLGLSIPLHPWRPGDPMPQSGLAVCPVPLAGTVTPGTPDPANAAGILASLDTAVAAVAAGHCTALVTGPIAKEVIARGTEHPFPGHTEYLAHLCGAGNVVMMLMGGGLRVALVTTHLPLREVPDAVTKERVQATLRTTVAGLHRDFALERPRLLVTGLNPHAGEQGRLGDEEERVIRPAIEEVARELGETAHLLGPVAADTAFTKDQTEGADAVVCMYHDQGLGPLKQQAFGRAVNLTLGLPIVRTSVDHGTAFDRAGSGQADAGSLREALLWARRLAANRAHHQGPSASAPASGMASPKPS